MPAGVGKNGSKHVANLIDDCREKCTTLMADCWAKSDEEVSARGLAECELGAADNPQFLQSMIRYLIDSQNAQKDARKE